MYVYKLFILYLLCMICEECYNLGEIDRSVVLVLSPPPLYFIIEKSKERARSPCNGNTFSSYIHKHFHFDLLCIFLCILLSS